MFANSSQSRYLGRLARLTQQAFGLFQPPWLITTTALAKQPQPKRDNMMIL
jgi:hypothetical protein